MLPALARGHHRGDDARRHADQQEVIVDLHPALAVAWALEPIAMIVAKGLLALPVGHALASRPVVPLRRLLAIVLPFLLLAVVAAVTRRLVALLGLGHRGSEHRQGDSGKNDAFHGEAPSR